MNKKTAMIALLVGFALSGGGIFVALTAPDDYTYEYEVKTEQVGPAANISQDEVTQFENLSEPEQEVLFRAFKKTDHFLGGASATVQTAEPLNISEKWKVVDIKGVPLLIGISVNKYTTFTLRSSGGLVMTLIGLSLITIAGVNLRLEED